MGFVGLFIGLVILAVACVLIGIGLAVGLVACGVAAVLVSLGVISSSLVIGLWKGRTTAGVRAFLLQCGVLTGIPAGAVCAWLGQMIFESYGSGWLIPVYGAIGGALAGVVVALALDFIFRRFHGWVAGRVTALSAQA